MEKQDSNVKQFQISDYPMCYDAWLDARIGSREVVIASSWLRTIGFESTIYVPDTLGWAMSAEDFTMFLLRWS